MSQVEGPLDGTGLAVSFHVLPPFLVNSPLAAVGYVTGFLNRSLPVVQTRTMYWNQSIARDCLSPDLRALLSPKAALFQNMNPMFSDALFAHVFGMLHARSEELRSLADTVGGLCIGEMRPGPNSFSDLAEQVFSHINARVEQDGFDRDKIVACSAQLNQIIPSLALLKLLKERNPEAVAVLGGLSAKRATMILRCFPFVDVCVFGEGERCFAELCRRIASDNDLSSLPGAAVRVNGDVRINQSPPPISGLDVAWAVWQGFDWTLPFELGYDDVFLPIWDSRGCPWAKCRFCHRVDRPFLERSPESITEEIAFQMEQHPCLDKVPKVVVQMLGDQLRGSSTNRLEKLLDGLGQLKEQYPNQELFCWLSPAHTTEAAMKRLDELRAKVQWGFEQWSSRVLALMDKPHTVEHGFNTLKLADRFSEVEVIAPNYLLGYPGERLEDVFEAQRNLQKLRFILASLGERIRFGATPITVQPNSHLGKTFDFDDPLVRESLAKHPHSRLFALMAGDSEAAIENAMELEFASIPDSHWTVRLGQLHLATFNHTLQHTELTCQKGANGTVTLRLMDPFTTTTVVLTELERGVLQTTEGITSLNKLEQSFNGGSPGELSAVVANLEDLDLLYVNQSRRRCINTLPYSVQRQLFEGNVP